MSDVRQQPVFRFAPSPNGFLHLGHAYSALLNARMAHAAGGRFLLRIEDIDLGRCRQEYEAAIYDDLAWLGLGWEKPVRRQSAHLGEYRVALDSLRERRLVYPCFATRRDIMAAVARSEGKNGGPWPRDPAGAPLYPGLARALSAAEAERRIAAGEPHAWRLDMAAALAAVGQPLTYRRLLPDGRAEPVVAVPARWGDVVIARKDVPTSYHLSVVLDDALQGVTHVVRGADLEAATDLHRLLQALFDLPTPLYHHHPLVLDGEGGKLSKSLQSESLRDLRGRGATPGALLRRLGFAPDVS
ncbi:tRNA glutamyl-Q(34) synthetase GluQRS [Chelatococcus sp. SYSU_G07232]|uniref:tRNA glutamyl-Q(34) synthetase GluQRS n=1 Tax=Chelatococcus albus TaxID=3047466 RepID=A0ABT7AJM7_9HYPH|nr:tRNA glutamyl-Q(34) synthetase GluQRS [Chelatococcus sp. SYSU_G07232]MDJ1159582.1 tRNA glutamyl-Q(34) synthetase GluQRS [Chelatococcus sp. SYSU_G07232]